ncbi:MAG: MotA/TolQ/ExbB proton channel family protein [Sneathiella sp.]|nr:MotA/TolQ/ExbB proton channel family protein [Sneathiella sp.]
MGLPLVVCSVLAMMICMERLAFFLVADFGGQKLLAKGMHILKLHQHRGKALCEEILSVALIDAKRPYGRGLFLLRLIAAVSPLMGLLGTILGIIEAFRIIAASHNPVSPNMIADGLWEALLTTAFGLMIALPTIILVSGFSAWQTAILDRVSSHLNASLLDLDMGMDSPKKDRINSNVSSMMVEQ